MIKKVKIEISAHHIHLNKEDFEALFGIGAELTVRKELSQPGMFAANETVDIKDDEFELKKVRIVGPIRNYTQIEITATEARNFKINPPLRLSGNIKDTPGITVIGPKGQIDIKEGVIIAKRHVHMTPEEADERNIKDGDSLRVRVNGERGLIFDNIISRVDKTYTWAMHIDTDEGNSAGMAGCGDGEMVTN